MKKPKNLFDVLMEDSEKPSLAEDKKETAGVPPPAKPGEEKYTKVNPYQKKGKDARK